MCRERMRRLQARQSGSPWMRPSKRGCISTSLPWRALTFRRAKHVPPRKLKEAEVARRSAPLQRTSVGEHERFARGRSTSLEACTVHITLEDVETQLLAISCPSTKHQALIMSRRVHALPTGVCGIVRRLQEGKDTPPTRRRTANPQGAL